MSEGSSLDDLHHPRVTLCIQLDCVMVSDNSFFLLSVSARLK